MSSSQTAPRPFSRRPSQAAQQIFYPRIRAQFIEPRIHPHFRDSTATLLISGVQQFKRPFLVTQPGFETYGWIAHYSGRQDSAVARVQRALALNEKDKVAPLFLGRAYQAQGRYPEAMREYQATGALLHWPVTVASAGYVAAKEGDREGVTRAFAELDSLASAPTLLLS